MCMIPIQTLKCLWISNEINNYSKRFTQMLCVLQMIMRRNVGLFITKREVKVSGFFAYSWMETETRSSRLRPLTHKNRTRLYYFEREHYFHLLSGQRADKIAPARSQSHCRIPFVSSAHGASHLIMSSKDWALNRRKWRARL